MRRAAISIWGLLKRATIEFSNDKAMKLSASLAYYTIFSLPPMIIVIVTTVGLVYGQEAVQGRVFSELNELVGNKAAFQVEQTIRSIGMEGDTRFAQAIGIITLILGATGVFTEIQDSINIIWGLKAKPRRGFLHLVVNRLLSFSMVVTMGFLLLVSLVLDALLSAFSDKLKIFFPDVTVYLFHVINFMLSFALTTLLFAIIFKVLPDAKIRWKDVIVGALTTALLFIIGKFLIGYYLGQSDLGSAYGAAGSVIILMIWVYYSSIILYYGAEFTQVYAYRYGSRIRPNKYAVWVVHKEVERREGTEWQSQVRDKRIE
jgi:membrane protein